MKNILITGAGSVATGIARQLIKGGNTVVFYDAIENPWASRIDFIKDKGEAVTFAKGDVLDFESLVRTCRSHGIEGLVHTAYVQDGPTFREGTFRNVLMIENCLEASKELGLKLVNISSVVAYGAAVSSGMVPLTQTLTEDDAASRFPVAPPGPYDTHPTAARHATTKRISEALVTFYSQTYDMQACSLRLGSVYGAGDAKLHFLPILLRLAIAGRKFELPYGADHPENFTFISDIGDLIVKIFAMNRLQHDLYIAAGTYLTLRDIAATVSKTVEGSSLKFGPGMIPKGCYGVTYVRPPISSERAIKELGYKVTNYDEGVRAVADWIRRNWSLVPTAYDSLPSGWVVRYPQDR